MARPKNIPTKEQLAERLNKLLKRYEKLRVAYANGWDRRYGHDANSPAIVADLNLVLRAGEKLNEQYRLLNNGDMYDHRFFEPRYYDELTTTGFGYHKRGYP